MFPAISAGTSFPAERANGQFQAVKAATTPTGRRVVDQQFPGVEGLGHRLVEVDGHVVEGDLGEGLPVDLSLLPYQGGDQVETHEDGPGLGQEPGPVDGRDGRPAGQRGTGRGDGGVDVGGTEHREGPDDLGPVGRVADLAPMVAGDELAADHTLNVGHWWGFSLLF